MCLSPGCRNEGLTHLHPLRGTISVWAEGNISPIVTFPPVSIFLAKLFFAELCKDNQFSFVNVFAPMYSNKVYKL